MLSSSNVIGGNVAEARYDRQIRLWGKQGQRALRDANVVALGASAAVVEALKSIVLTGVGSFTIVDERRVGRAHLASNYFLAVEDEGASLAERVASHLGELNEECVGYADDSVSPAQWVAAMESAVHSSATHTQAAQRVSLQMQAARRVPPGDARDLSQAQRAPSSSGSPHEQLHSDGASAHGGNGIDNADHVHQATAELRLPTLFLVSNRYADFSGISALVQTAALTLNVPVVLVDSRGLTGYLQTFSRDRIIVHPHRSNDQLMEDLRIFSPFAELRAWFEAHDPADTNLFRADDADSLVRHSHLPYLCLLYHAFKHLQQKRRESGLDALAWPLPPAAFAELRKEVSLMVLRADPPQESFQEALNRCNVRLNRPFHAPPPLLNALFADARCENPAAVLDACCAESCASAAVLPALPDTQQLLEWYLIKAVRQFFEASGGGADAGAVGAATEAPQPSGDRPLTQQRLLPLCGYVPDFTTTTAWFQELRAIYQRQHETDVRRVAQLAAALVRKDAESAAARAGECVDRKRFRRSPSQLEDSPGSIGLTPASLLNEALASTSDDDFLAVAKDVVANVWFLCAVSFSPSFTVSDSTALPPQEAHDETAVGGNEQQQRWRRALRGIMRAALDNLRGRGPMILPEDSRRACAVGLALLAVHERERRSSVEPSCTQQCEAGANVARLPEASTGAVMEELMSLLFTPDNSSTADTADLSAADMQLLRGACHEVERVGHTEMISVAAVIGSLAAQEATKLIQRRRVPITYPMVYSGIDGVCYNLPA